MSATVVGLNIYGSELTRNRHRRQADTHPALRPDPAPLRSFGDEVRGGDLLRHAETAARLGEPHREEITTEFASREGDVFFLVFVRWSKTGPSASTPLRAP
jgi:hypothetical protein